MAIREDIVASAITFLQDPNVVGSSVENKISFLRSKNLTQDEIDASFARSGQSVGAPPMPSPQAVGPAQPAYYPPPQYPPQQPYGAWPQAPPPEPPRRDWRDLFIMATVVGGVSYGLYAITKRYIYPLVAPPTPEKLEQDKATVDEQFEKAFATIEQLSKDTEALKASEQERTEKLDKVLEDLESFIKDTRSASRRQEDETDRLREEMKSLQGLIPKSMTAQKEHSDRRLREISDEVKSLKSLISQRMSAPAPAAAAPATLPYGASTATATANGTSSTLRPSTANNNTNNNASTPATPTPAKENGETSTATTPAATTAAPASKADYISSLGGRSSPFGSGMPGGKASIPAWQLAASKGPSSSDQTAAGSSS
ncbi:peroxisomal membrane anchor protein conserved region-domain-containing protein [Microdochium trichocladiopsis]|uniref:Peroxisomal membrane protein PEX14 n=1 Tax=Microdochium trichocladiopsis TaxID=1682393 RepID=A0A9P8Y2U4_9PEZI|nr:peroxisomal membrane anchor protein conserved region-domain-containing protein [Microdochium trichocladiopsis]KAH7027873.1 peroxisomal membrane anchor protein conserved region-domain-containing protein [Microdochium trichocladiopsis]